ncbi:hypothetical protein [Paludisphaera soli]|uniref:hypothetical protein n=1 Tax=Paludisphaera soli TaxID=2712865 RepID=UPI0013EAA31E|nr:hypothetical protein [Paludisphaera soli]
MQPEPSTSIAGTAAPGPVAARPRGPSILHLTFLVAAAAVTVAAWPLVPYLDNAVPRSTIRPVACLVLTAYFWSPVIAALLLAGPADRRRDAARSYGTAAVVAIALSAAWLTVRCLGAEAVRQQLYASAGLYPPTSRVGLARLIFPAAGSYYSPVAQQLIQGASNAGCAILAVWAILALTGAGRRPKGWLEWSSFAFGLAWVAFHALNGFLAVAMGSRHYFHSFEIQF